MIIGISAKAPKMATGMNSFSMSRCVMTLGLVLITMSSTMLSVEAHGHMTSPRSRNFYASESGGASAGIPPKEYCPHCLNTNTGVCGASTTYNYDHYVDVNNNPVPWTTQDTYAAGEVITIKTYLSTHHNGHLEVRACAMGSASTQACFNTAGHELTFVRDVMWGMPADAAHPERGYLYGGQGGSAKDFEMEFRLPDGIAGDKVMLQWKYITANSCSPPGYTAYFNGSNSQNQVLPTSFWSPGVTQCTPPYPNDGTRSSTWPEQFFNCAEVTITDPQPTTSPAPTTAPVTAAPIAPTVPVVMPTWEPNNGCCSLDFQKCETWCGTTKQECETCSSTSDVVWLPGGARTGCLAKYWDCTQKSNACCSGLTCVQFSQFYSQCQYVKGTTPAPTTVMPVTPAPTTPKPVTPAPTTAKPVTPAPTTAKPVTPAPTAKPVTPAPTNKPVTPAPTAKPVTPAPTTKKPVTPAPTAKPVTPAPTKKPVTPAPTAKPVTSAPTTLKPVTPAPTTLRPVTPAPTTAAPVSQPTSVIPTTGVACCTQFFNVCDTSNSYCSTVARCGIDSACTYLSWMPNGQPVDPNSCNKRWAGCADKACCPGLVCTTTPWGWKGCYTAADAALL